jgi:type II secretory pathway pseudopilin PulG
MQRKERRFITLIEMMIVMFLIALIIGVLAYNYGGSLDEGKAFKTKMAIEKVSTILNLEAAKNPQFLQGTSNWQAVIRASPLVKNANDFIKDGWGEDLQVEVHDNIIHVYSRHLEEYKRSHPTSIVQ